MATNAPAFVALNSLGESLLVALQRVHHDFSRMHGLVLTQLGNRNAVNRIVATQPGILQRAAADTALEREDRVARGLPGSLGLALRRSVREHLVLPARGGHNQLVS